MMSRLPILLLFLLLTPFMAPTMARAQDFPRLVEHTQGSTIIPARPRRIVSVGYHEQDFLYALNIAPVGLHEWFGDRPFATWGWAEPRRQALNARPAVQRGYQIDVEWVFAQKPDLIVASFFNLDPSTYQLLSRIAPVITAPRGYPVWGAPWQAELRLIARATGTEARAEKIIADIETRIGALAVANPGFRGKSATVGYYAGGQFIGYRGGEGGNGLLQQLGLQTPPIFDALVQSNGQFGVSPERLDLFEADAVLWLVDPHTAAHIQAMPIYRQTRLARQGRSIWADPELSAALSFMTPLSIPYALDRLAPLLRDALDGRPAPQGEEDRR